MYESVTTGVRRSELMREAAEYRRRSGIEAGLRAERLALARRVGSGIAMAMGRLLHVAGPRERVPAARPTVARVS